MTAVASENSSVPKNTRTMGRDAPSDWMTDMVCDPLEIRRRARRRGSESRGSGKRLPWPGAELQKAGDEMPVGRMKWGKKGVKGEGSKVKGTCDGHLQPSTFYPLPALFTSA